MTKIDNIKTNRFTYRDIMDEFKIKNYQELKNVVDEWISEGIIQPIKLTGMTSFKPAIHQEYRKVKQKGDYSSLLPEIKRLHPSLNMERYLKNPAVYAENTNSINQLSDYLWVNNGKSLLPISVKERSYAIWNDEKFLENEGKSICSWNGLDEETLAYFKAPEPYFFTDLHRKNEDVTVIVIENKDTWYSLSKALKESNDKEIFEISISYVVFGEGRKVTKENGIKDFLDDMICQPYRVLYVGDIDIEGIRLLYGCISANVNCDIGLFIPLYKAMINKNIPISHLKETEDYRGLEYDRSFFTHFTEQEKHYIENILSSNKRLPQEVLNYQDYLGLVQ